MSIAAALAWTGDISMRDRLVLGINFSSAEWGGGDGLRYRSIS